jgi:hypothetical protein
MDSGLHTDDCRTIAIPVSVTGAEQAGVIGSIQDAVITEFQVEHDVRSGPIQMTAQLDAVIGERDCVPPSVRMDEPSPSDEFPSGTHPVYEVYETVTERIEECKHAYGGHIDKVVLGEPQVRALCTWIEFVDGKPESMAELFGVREVITVPGPQIHPVVPREVWMDGC